MERSSRLNLLFVWFASKAEGEWNGQWRMLSNWTDSSKHIPSCACIDTLFYRIKVIHFRHKSPAKRHNRLNERYSIGQWEPLKRSGYHLSRVNERTFCLFESSVLNRFIPRVGGAQTLCPCPSMNYTCLRSKQIDIWIKNEPRLTREKDSLRGKE